MSDYRVRDKSSEASDKHSAPYMTISETNQPPVNSTRKLPTLLVLMLFVAIALAGVPAAGLSPWIAAGGLAIFVVIWWAALGSVRSADASQQETAGRQAAETKRFDEL